MDTSDSGYYLVYSLLNQHVEVLLPSSGRPKRLHGLVSAVERDVLSDSIRVTFNGSSHVFDEPTCISKDGNAVVFTYGRSYADESDDELFREMAVTNESVDEVLKRTVPDCKKELRFVLNPV